MGGKLTVYCDGGSRGNPGKASYGFVVYENNNKIFEEGKFLGINTNNFAEYMAIIKALEYIAKSHLLATEINFLLDSRLAVEQLTGKWKVKNENIRNLYYLVKTFEKKLNTKITYKHIPRENNKEADKLVNIALDAQI